jgi:drug/metabolite transporter (DMT)-like permease
MGFGSGVTYAGVLVWLRALRDVSPAWLTVVNHLGAAIFLAPFALYQTPPTWGQLAWLAVFGGLQMGLPYLLMARALRSVSPQEAGMLTLLEPLLNPCLAYLVAPDAERPAWTTAAGGAIILLALVWRYAPGMRRRTRPDTP